MGTLDVEEKSVGEFAFLFSRSTLVHKKYLKRYIYIDHARILTLAKQYAFCDKRR